MKFLGPVLKKNNNDIAVNNGVLQVNLHSDLFDNHEGAYYLDYNNLTNKPSSMPANGGEADTLDGYHASDFELAKSPIGKKTLSAVLTLSEKIILADSTSGNITLTLPAASLSLGKTYKVKKINSANSIIIDANGSDTIDGELTYAINYQYQSIELVCDGTEWFVM